MLESLFYPKTVAVIGASREPGKVGYEVVANLVHSGFAGKIIPINPKATDVLGIKCYPDLKSAGVTIDLAVVVVSLKVILNSVREAIQAGAKSIVVITAGFKEVDAQGAALEKELVEICRAGGARLMGPNCVGILNTDHHMNATFAPSMPPSGRISVISQSGALCVAILDWCKSRNMGLAKVISFGNKADLNEVDFLQALADDQQTAVVAGYLESISEGDEFLRIAEQTASTKPVVILKVGVTSAGAKAAASHTGSLAGADMAYGAAFKRSGVIRAENFEALFDYAQAFAMQPLPAGNRVGIITNAGGPGIMATDAAEIAGLKVVAPTDETKKLLREGLPASASVNNPVNVIGDADPDRYTKAFSILQDDPNVDAIIVVVTPQNMTQPFALAEKLAQAHKGKKPVLAAFMGGEEVFKAQKRLMELNIPAYPSAERAVASLQALCDYAAWRKRDPRVVARFPVNRRRVERVIGWNSRMGITQVGEVEAKEILRAYDFSILPGGLAQDSAQAVEIAERIGYPVVLKISSPDIIHKSDFGGVRINLANAEQVRDAFDLMMLRVHLPRPQRPHPRRLCRKNGLPRPRSHPRHDPRPPVRTHAHVRPRRHLCRSYEGRHLLPRPHHRR